MVKQNSLILIMFFIMLFIQCCTQQCKAQCFTAKEIEEAIMYNTQQPKDSIYLLDINGITSMYICTYVNSYLKQPKDINFLIKAFERTESFEDFKSAFSWTFHLLEKYKDDLLLYTSDSVTAIFYKTVELGNLVAASVCVKPDLENDYVKTLHGFLYFDKDGYSVGSEEKREQYRKEINAIIRKYNDNGWEERILEIGDVYGFKVILLEFMPNKGLVNFETQEPIDWKSSEYFREIEKWMRKTVAEHGYSKMIIPSPIPLHGGICNAVVDH